MLYLITKALLSGVIIMAASEAAKRSPTYGALLVSLPLVSDSRNDLAMARYRGQ